MHPIVRRAEELLLFAPAFPELAAGQPAPGRDDYFDEAMFCDVRVSPVRSTAGALIDLRGAEQFVDADVAVLVVTEVSEVRLAQQPQPQWRWRTIFGSRIAIGAEKVTVEVGITYAGEQLVVEGRSALLYVGTVPELGQIPDFGGPDVGGPDDTAIGRGLPQWSHPVRLTRFWSIQPR